MLALRLFLPESWTSKPARLKRAGVPAEYRTARTKPEMALAEIDRVIAAGVRFGCVLAEAGYGMSAPFRQGLTARKLAWAVGIPRRRGRLSRPARESAVSSPLGSLGDGPPTLLGQWPSRMQTVRWHRIPLR